MRFSFLIFIIASTFIAAVVLSCAPYDSTVSSGTVDTTDIDSLTEPANTSLDSLNIQYTEIKDSSGMLIDSMTLGSFRVVWSPVPFATNYHVFLWRGNSDSNVVTTDLNYYFFDSLLTEQTYKVKVQALRITLSTDSLSFDTLKSDITDSFVVAELYQPVSPGGVVVDYDNATARVYWEPVSNVLITGYRAYLRDAYGVVVDSSDVPIHKRGTAFFDVLEDTVYKINVISLSTIGMSKICSTYTYDGTTIQDTLFKLPYAYLSTSMAPDENNAVSTVLGSGNILGVAGGIFAMGDIWEGNTVKGNGKPVHEVIVSSFYMSRIEISNAFFAQFLNEYDGILYTFDTLVSLYTFALYDDTLLAPSGHFVFDSVTGTFSVSTDTAVYPVTGVYWKGAAVFCNWLSGKDGFTSCYDTSDWHFDTAGTGYRLPTEAEYEYVHSAAFSGTKQRYPWGYNHIPGNYGSLSSGLNKIGTYNPYFGFYDLTGNALEWCHDLSDHLANEDSTYYVISLQAGVVSNPYGPDSGPYHVLRGGSYLHTGEMNTSAYRHVNPGADFTGYGFRVARSIRK